MDGLRYEAPDSLDAAVALLAEAGGDARVFAGGTDVIVQMQGEMIDPDLLVDIKNIPELNGIAADGDGWRVGAAVSAMEIVDHDGFTSAWPGVVEGVSLIGSVQVKGRATMAGNLCNASPAADSVPALIAAGAVATVVGPGGRREVAVEDIATGPGATSLAKGEVLVSISFPKRPPHSGDSYLRLTPRTEMDIAVVGSGVNLTLDDSGNCTAARVSICAVAPTVLLVDDAAKALIGTSVDAAALENMTAAVRAACNPISDKRGTREYRIKTAGVIARRAAENALERARGN